MLSPTTSDTPLRLSLTSIAGTLLGLALPSFYLLPAAYERRFVQVTMAIIPGMRPQDNFLFAHTSDPGRNGVNHQVTLLALTLIALTFAALLALFLRRNPPPTNPRRPRRTSALVFLSVLPEENLLLALPILATVLTFLLLPPSTFLWLHVPDLAFLQLPWRLLTLLTPILALAIALLLSKETGAPRLASETWVRRLSTPATLAATLLLPLALGFAAFHLYSQFCSPDETPSAIAQNLLTHHGFPPTDEYTPNRADNDLLRTNNPSFWLLPNLSSGQPANPNNPAPNTTPTAAELNPSLDTDDSPIPLSQTLSTGAPTHLSLNLQQPSTLVLNLRDYPNWSLTTTSPATSQLPPSAQDRDDGLITMQLPRGQRDIDITWHRTPDQTLGLALSALALLTYALTHRRTP